MWANRNNYTWIIRIYVPAHAAFKIVKTRSQIKVSRIIISQVAYVKCSATIMVRSFMRRRNVVSFSIEYMKIQLLILLTFAAVSTA